MIENEIWGYRDERGLSRGQDIIKVLQTIGATSVLDIACGDGDVLTDIKKTIPNINDLGIDIREYPQWKTSPASFSLISLQEYIKKDTKWDVILMLNSYRNKHDLPQQHDELFIELDKWLIRNAKYFITSLSHATDDTLHKPYEIIGNDTNNIPLVMYTL